MRQFLSLADYRKFQATHALSGRLDILVPTLSGNFRGKRIPLGDMGKLIKGELTLPLSAMSMDPAGETPRLLEEGAADGDPDVVYLPLRHSLSPVVWSEEKKRVRAQVMVTADDKDPYAKAYQNPRAILQKACDVMRARGLTAQAAVELEFFLIDPRSKKSGVLRPPLSLANLRRVSAEQCLGMQALEDFEPFLKKLEQVLELQNLKPQAISAEYSVGQFEINQPHGSDLLLVCDRAMLLKHAVKAVARSFGLEAIFMAKPYLSRPGSGMHVHMSLYNKAGKNIFAGENKEEFSQDFLHVVGGLSRTAADFFICFAPLGNSYRRFCGNAFAPLHNAWGRNNRSAALRVPRIFSGVDCRIEHRLSGADACPYLVMAAILLGMDYGLSHKVVPPRESFRDRLNERYDLPLRWGEALYRFGKSSIVSGYLGRDVHRFLHGYFASEYEAYHDYMPRRDIERYLEIT